MRLREVKQLAQSHTAGLEPSLSDSGTYATLSQKASSSPYPHRRFNVKLCLVIVTFSSCHHKLEGPGLWFTKETEALLINLAKVTQLKSGRSFDLGSSTLHYIGSKWGYNGNIPNLCQASGGNLPSVINGLAVFTDNTHFSYTCQAHKSYCKSVA